MDTIDFGNPLDFSNAQPLVPSRDEAPWIRRYDLAVSHTHCGDAESYAREAADGEYVEHAEHVEALTFEQARADTLQAILDSQAAEIARLKVEAEIRIRGTASALAYLREAEALYLHNGASQCEVEQHMFRIRDLASEAEHVLGRIEADLAWLSRAEEDA